MTKDLTPRGAKAILELGRIPVLAVVGVGLIGGSFAAALRKHGKVDRILGVGRRPQTLLRAQSLGLIDEAVSPREAAEQADLILLSLPVGGCAQVLGEMVDNLAPHALVTDAGSTKASVVQSAYEVLGDRVGQFVPGHPIAGAETTGPEAADATLYQNRTVVLTPLDENTETDRKAVQRAWEFCGARVLSMEPEAHDRALASVSHVPHFLASVFMTQVASAADSDLRLGLAGSGFRDFTRIAAGSPEMWRDIFLANRDAVLAELAEVRAALQQAEQCLAREDGQGLHDFLEKAAVARRFWGSRSGFA